ncbi:MAG TPA: hypothetical protein DCQ31_06960 [Bacteroidales bacterium]|nr:hypothetical protein [Bacteroidales bacterium]
MKLNYLKYSLSLLLTSILCNLSLAQSPQMQQLLTPTAAFSFTTKGCSGDTVFFKNESTDFSAIKWEFGDGFDTYTTNPVHIYSGPGTYTVKLTAIKASTSEISVIAQKMVTINPIPTISLSYAPDTLVQFGQTVTITATGTFDNLVWEPSKEITNEIIVNKGGFYSVRASFSSGCAFTVKSKQIVVKPLVVDTDTLVLKVLNDIMTPNGDAVNDLLVIDKLSELSEPITLTIYNRWGELVYTNPIYDNLWDGTNKGNPLPAGTYYYYVSGGGRKGTTGFVDIIR